MTITRVSFGGENAPFYGEYVVLMVRLEGPSPRVPGKPCAARRKTNEIPRPSPFEFWSILKHLLKCFEIYILIIRR